MKQAIESYFTGNYSRFYRKYFQQVKKIGGEEYQALCPFHNDKKPSFSFNNQTGKYFCYGCGRKGHALHFYGKIHNLDTRRDFPKILRGIAHDFGIPWEEEKKRIVKVYDYTDCEGNLFSQVCRMEPKDFRQRRPDGNEGWIWNLKGIEPVLYNLPTVLRNQEILILEGEKDVDTAMTLGLTATTCPMGARKWRSQYNEVLRGKDVILIPDNDSEGRQHMTQVAISLNGTARSLKWIDLPGVPSKGDLSDWVKGFADPAMAAEQLAVMIEGAEPYEPPEKKSHDDVVLKVSDFSSVITTTREIYLYPWLKEDSINLISGWRGTGKTWTAMEIANAISRGTSFGPWKCNLSVPCLFLDGEMPSQDINERITVLGLNEPGRKNPLYIYSEDLASQYGLSKSHLASDSWRTTMKRILTTRHVKLWVIDNLATLASGLDENSKKDWDLVNQWLLELRFTGIATIMLHHTNKEGGQRGTSAREDNIDVSILLKQPHDYTPDDGARFIVHFTKARVRTTDLPLIADTEFKLIEQDGRSTWTWGDIKGSRKREILRMIDEGLDTNAICEILGVTRQYVSVVKNKAITKGHLSKSGKLTQPGFLFVSEIENG